jgi:hypothetical protein
VDGNLLVLRGGRLADSQAAAKTRQDGRITFRDGRLLDSSTAGSDQWNAADSSVGHTARDSWSRVAVSQAGSDVSSSQRSVWSGGGEEGLGSAANSRASTAQLSSEHRRASTTQRYSQVSYLVQSWTKS